MLSPGMVDRISHAGEVLQGIELSISRSICRYLLLKEERWEVAPTPFAAMRL